MNPWRKTICKILKTFSFITTRLQHDLFSYHRVSIVKLAVKSFTLFLLYNMVFLIFTSKESFVRVLCLTFHTFTHLNHHSWSALISFLTSKESFVKVFCRTRERAERLTSAASAKIWLLSLHVFSIMFILKSCTIFDDNLGEGQACGRFQLVCDFLQNSSALHDFPHWILILSQGYYGCIFLENCLQFCFTERCWLVGRLRSVYRKNLKAVFFRWSTLL